jgi:hypothetical protein
MHDPRGVRHREGVGHLIENDSEARGQHRSARVELVRERAARHELHRQEGSRLAVARVVHAHDVPGLAAQHRGHLRLEPESLEDAPRSRRAREELVFQELDRDLLLQVQVIRHPDLSDPTHCEALQESITASNDHARGADRRVDDVHERPLRCVGASFWWSGQSLESPPRTPRRSR